MRLTVVHTADIHIGKNRRYSDYLDQHRMMLDALLKVVEEQLRQPGLVWLVVSGDIFERNEDTIREEVELWQFHLLNPVLRLAEQHPNFYCFVIDGNHDRVPVDPKYPRAPSLLSPFDALSTDRVVIRSKRPLHLPEHRLLMVPFDNYSESELHHLVQQHPSQFVMFHECLARMQTDTGWSPPREQDGYIEVENILADCPLAAMFVGDIHRCQPLDQQRICWYSGSLATLDFGHKLPKGTLVHRFVKKSDDLWVRDGDPELVDLPDDRIRSHHQLGKVLTVDDIPMDFLREFRRRYFMMTITPEVYQTIDREIPEFFHAPTVSYEFEREEAVEVQTVDDEPVDDTIDEKSIVRWIGENLVELTAEEREEATRRVLKDFASR